MNKHWNIGIFWGGVGMSLILAFLIPGMADSNGTLLLLMSIVMYVCWNAGCWWVIERNHQWHAFMKHHPRRSGVLIALLLSAFYYVMIFAIGLKLAFFKHELNPIIFPALFILILIFLCSNAG